MKPNCRETRTREKIIKGNVESVGSAVPSAPNGRRAREHIDTRPIYQEAFNFVFLFPLHQATALSASRD